MFNDGLSIAEISRRLQRSYSNVTVSSILKKFRETGSVENLHRSVRPRLVTDRDYCHLERTVKCNRREITSKFNEGRIKPVCKRTVQIHLRKHGFSKRVSKVILKCSFIVTVNCYIDLKHMYICRD